MQRLRKRKSWSDGKRSGERERESFSAVMEFPKRLLITHPMYTVNCSLE